MRLRHVATLISAHSRALSVGRNQLYSLTSAHGTPGQPVPTNDDPSACSTSSRSTTSSPSESSHRLLPLGHHHRGFSSATSSITLWGDDEEEVVSGSAATGAGAATSSGGGPAEDGQLTPQAVVAHLDGFIIGQEDAKKAVAIAFRNRWRRHRVPDEMKESIMPKNILLIGPTGCGKTEIARRLAKLADAPFVKVEATKFTEVGYHGRDVDTIIRDLLDNSIVLVRQRLKAKAQAEIKLLVEERLLKLLVGADAQVARLDVARVQLRAGKLERSIVDVDVGSRPGGSDATSIGGGGPGGQVPTMVIDLQRMISGSGGLQRRERRRLTVEEARPVLEDAEAERMFPQEVVIKEAIKLAEQDGIVFIDEARRACARRRVFGHPSTAPKVLAILQYNTNPNAGPTSTYNAGGYSLGGRYTEQGYYVDPYGLVSTAPGIYPVPAANVTLDTQIIFRANSKGVVLGTFDNRPWELTASANTPTLLEVVKAGGNQSSFPWSAPSHSFNLGDSVRIFINNTDGGEHPLHLHGQDFYVLGRGRQGDGAYDPARDTLNTKNPIVRDVATIAGTSWIVLQFQATRQGIWMFHCHIEWHMSAGLAMVFVVGY